MFANDVKHGKGKLRQADGKVFEGEYVNDKRHGKGYIISPNGQKEEVIFENGLKKVFE